LRPFLVQGQFKAALQSLQALRRQIHGTR
jgi:hypothetical protein